jgi:hypothetical protein
MDYHMFGPLKEVLCGQRFASGDEVKDMVQYAARSELKTFFTDG